MIDLSDMAAADVAVLANLVGAELVDRDPALAAKTFTDLNGKADAALGEKVVRYRLGVAHSKRAAVSSLATEIARSHFVTVDAIMGSRHSRHLVSARSHLAHTLKHRLRFSMKEIAVAMACNKSTASRHVRAWARHIGGEA